MLHLPQGPRARRKPSSLVAALLLTVSFLSCLAVHSFFTVRAQVIVADDLGRITHVNSFFEFITGYSRAEVVGRNCNFLQGPDTEQQAVQVRPLSFFPSSTDSEQTV